MRKLLIKMLGGITVEEASENVSRSYCQGEIFCAKHLASFGKEQDCDAEEWRNRMSFKIEEIIKEN